MSSRRVRSPSRRHLRSRRDGHAYFGIVLLLCLAQVESADARDARASGELPGATDASLAAQPTLQLGQSRFPELLMHLPRLDQAGSRVALACDQIRARRLDELDPTWKRAVDRIHLECEPLPSLGDGEPETIATVVTAYLKPGTALFLQAPVVEVRLMDSDLWSDHQYVLAAPYPELADALQRHLLTRCEAAPVDKAILSRRDCVATRSEEGLFVADRAVGGAWAYPDPFDARRTVYAEGWAE